METIKLIPISTELLIFLFIDVAIAVLLLSTLKWSSGKLSSVDSNDELCTRDNFAFGISLAARMFALCIVLTGAIASSTTTDFTQAAKETLLFGVLGILLIKVGRFAHDKLTLNHLDKEAQIRDRNISIAIVDGASAIATAIIIRSVILWVEGANLNAVIAVITGFVVAQTILLATTRLYERRFAENNQMISLQKTLTRGQIALAIQHAGTLLGTSIAVSSANSLLIYQQSAYVSNLAGWLVVGLALALLLSAIMLLLRRLILSGIDTVREIDLQHNLGVAAMEMSLSIGIALVISGLIHA